VSGIAETDSGVIRHVSFRQQTLTAFNASIQYSAYHICTRKLGANSVLSFPTPTDGRINNYNVNVRTHDVPYAHRESKKTNLHTHTFLLIFRQMLADFHHFFHKHAQQEICGEINT